MIHNMIKVYDVGIIGAGPAGLMAAITASSMDKKTVLIERNAQLGRKLFSTGNGRCNLMNKMFSVDRFHGSSPEFIETVIKQFDAAATMNFFQNAGLLLNEEDNGRIFPITNQASSVVDLLGRIVKENNVDIHLDSYINGIHISNDIWELSVKDKRPIKSRKLILATGGRASHHLGSTGDGLYWAEKMGHSLTPIYPALVPVETKETWVKDVQGVKIDASVYGSVDGKMIAESRGDLLFTSYGVSGPTVMSLAGRIAPYISTSVVEFHIDMFPDIAADELLNHFNNSIKYYPSLNAADILSGILPGSFVSLVKNMLNISAQMNAGSISDNQWLEIINHLKNIKLVVSKLRPLKEAQVTSGGICCNEVNPETLESKLIKGLYFAGEILDVDGDSGGFNLQWAWSSGYTAGRNAGI